jgi:hypothetical protein
LSQTFCDRKTQIALLRGPCGSVLQRAYKKCLISTLFSVVDCLLFFVINFELLHPSPYASIIATIVSGGAILFLLYFINFFSKSIPEIADKSYMSLLAYAELNSDTEEEGTREMPERMI